MNRSCVVNKYKHEVHFFFFFFAGKVHIRLWLEVHIGTGVPQDATCKPEILPSPVQEVRYDTQGTNKDHIH